MGCASQRSVEVGPTHSKKSKSGSNHPTAATRRLEESSSGLKVKNSWGLFSFSKPSISFGIHKLIVRNFKSFSQLFVYKEIEEMEKETEMEIGFPTDVKHVGHIGWDRSTSTNPVKGWDNLKTPEILSFPSISLKQFELAMAAQVDHSPMGATSVANYT